MIEGLLSIDVWRSKIAGDIKNIEISSTRPLHACQLIVGKSPQVAMQIIPMMFNICGVAQTFNARTVLNQGQTNNHNALEILVLTETLKEHLLRIFLDSPKLLALKPKTINLPFVAQLVKNMQSTLFANNDAFDINNKLIQDTKLSSAFIDEIEMFLVEHLFSMPLEKWQEINSEKKLNQWLNKNNTITSKAVTKIISQEWASQGCIEVNKLPALDENELTEVLTLDNSPHFIAQPTWRNTTCETTPLTRQINSSLIKTIKEKYGLGLLSRWLARVVEIAKIPSQMRVLLKQKHQSKNKTSNVSQIEAARGRLIHRAVVEHNSIKSYQIIAPTEWNFHPQGCVFESLKNIKTKSVDEYLKIAHLIINSIDPCVGYKLRVI